MSNPSNSLAGLRLLLVEDNRDVADLTALALGALGAHVDCAYDGESGISKALVGSYDAMVLDLGLPDIGGVDVARQLRAHAGTLRIVGLSGFDRELGPDVVDLFDVYLQKPVGAAEIAGAVLASGETT